MIIFSFSLSSISSYACEFCGCGVGNFYLGMLPEFKSKFIGVRYQYTRYNTHIADEPSEFSHDYYHTVELWSGWNLGKKWQLLTFVPYHINKQNTDDGIKKSSGLGDVTLLANYKVFDSKKLNESSGSNEQQFWIGAGIKLPTGSFNLDLAEPDLETGDVNSQNGTGSVDFLLNGTYNVRFNQSGINTSVNYKINTANNQHYYFGNRFTANSFYYHRFNAARTAIAPNIGLVYEHADGNKLGNEKIEHTGGFLLGAAGGVEVNFRKMAVGGNLQLPVSQDFASGQTESKLRGMLHITFTL